MTKRSSSHQPTIQKSLDSDLANHIIQRLAEGGQPPELGIQHINVGNESYLNILENEYLKRILKGGSSFKLVEGYFGGGKTHFLFCVRELAWLHGFATSLVELSPQECPYDNSLRVYQAVVRGLALAPGKGELSPNPGLTELLTNFADDLVEENGQEMALDYLKRTLRRASCECPSYRQAIVTFIRAEVSGDENTATTVGAWLNGEAVTPAMVREFGIFETMTRSNAFAMLRSLCQMIVGLGLPGVVLLFDEVDRTMSVGPRRTRAIGDNLRHVIDLCGRAQLPNTLFLYAVPPEFMRNVAPDYPALYQRLKSPIPFSVRSPQAPIIDLTDLDLEPAPLLEALGIKILHVFEIARGVSFDHELQERNIRLFAESCVESEFELNHRRLFVKVITDALFRQLADGEQDFSALAHEQFVVQALENLVGDDDDWDDDMPEDDDPELIQ